MNMARKEGPGDYQIGIYMVQREGRKWLAFGDGGQLIKEFDSLDEAHIYLTGESRRREKGEAR